MKTSSKVLLAALAVLLALFLAFVLTMSFKVRGLLEQRGRTAQAVPAAAAAVLPERAPEAPPWRSV
jgi:hypothetical protein